MPRCFNVKILSMSSSRNFDDESFVQVEPVPQDTVGCMAASHGDAVRLRRHIFLHLHVHSEGIVQLLTKVSWGRSNARCLFLEAFRD